MILRGMFCGAIETWVRTIQCDGFEVLSYDFLAAHNKGPFPGWKRVLPHLQGGIIPWIFSCGGVIRDSGPVNSFTLL